MVVVGRVIALDQVVVLELREATPYLLQMLVVAEAKELQMDRLRGQAAPEGTEARGVEAQAAEVLFGLARLEAVALGAERVAVAQLRVIIMAARMEARETPQAMV